MLINEQGLAAFWRGNLANSYKHILIPSFNYLTYIILKSNLPSSSSESLAVISSTLSLMLVYPIDMAQTRITCDMSKFIEERRYKSVLDCLRITLNHKGTN